MIKNKQKLINILLTLNNIRSLVKFNEEQHSYQIEGAENVMSVSDFINPFNEEFNALMNPKSPKYNHHLASNMPFFQLRGKLIHKWTETFDQKKGVCAPIPNLYDYCKYYNHFYQQYIASNKWMILATESIVFNNFKDICVAGTIDRLYMNLENKEVYLLDIKTGSPKHINVYQQAVYKKLLENYGIKIDKCYLLSLKNGSNLIEIRPEALDKCIEELREYWFNGKGVKNENKK